MPYELREYSPALRFLEQDAQQNLMMIRGVRMGPRPGFSVIVDDPDNVRAVLTVYRPEWKRPGNLPMTLQMDSSDRAVALDLLSWLPQGIRYRVQAYRGWLQEAIASLIATDRVVHRVHCMATRDGFLPSRLQEHVQEMPVRDDLVQTLSSLAPELRGERVTRVFGLVEDDELVAFSALGQPESEFIPVGMVYTRRTARSKGLGTAVLSAATQAGLAIGKSVTFGLLAEDMPSLKMVAGLGYFPACREWTLEGVLTR